MSVLAASRRAWISGALLALVISVLAGAPAAAVIPNARLTNDAASSIRPRVALDPNGNAVVVWQDNRYGNDEILWQKLDPLGNPLSGVVRVTNTAAASHWPDVACGPNGVSHVAWQEGDNVNGVGTVFFWPAIPTSSYQGRGGSVASCGSPSITNIAGATSTTTTASAMGGASVIRVFDAGGNIQYVVPGGGICTISQGAGQATTPSVG